MAKVEIAPATVRDTGISLAPWGGCLLYFGGIAILDGLMSPGPVMGPLAWVTPVLLIAGVMLVVGGVVILALDKRDERRQHVTDHMAHNDLVRSGDRLYLDLFERGDLAGLEECARWFTDAGMDVPKPLSTYLEELRKAR